MWWMCLNHNPSGAAGGANNLQSWNYAQHAYHLGLISAQEFAAQYRCVVLSLDVLESDDAESCSPHRRQ